MPHTGYSVRNEGRECADGFLGGMLELLHASTGIFPAFCNA